MWPGWVSTPLDALTPEAEWSPESAEGEKDEPWSDPSLPALPPYSWVTLHSHVPACFLPCLEKMTMLHPSTYSAQGRADV